MHGRTVALVVLRADASRGGAEGYTRQLAAALASRGWTPTVVCAEGSGGVEAIGWDGKARDGRLRSFASRLTVHLRQRRYDLVHAMLPLPAGLADVYHPHAGVAAGRGRLLSWLTNPRRRRMARWERGMLGGGGTVTIALSRYVQKGLERHHGGVESRLIYNGIDLRRYVPRGTQRVPGPPRMLFVGHDFRRKGLATAVRAVAGVPGVRLDVVGRDAPAPYRRLAGRLGAGDRVRFLPPGDVLPMYHGNDALILPTRHDPCPLVVLEALACGLPVLTTPGNGAGELMADDFHGFNSLGPDDADGFARAVATLAQPGRLEAARAACVGLRPTLDFEAHAGRVADLYEEIWGRRGRPVDSRA